MRKRISRGGVAVEPGTLGFASLPAAVLADGTSVTIPIVIVNGSEDGPTIWVDAVMHGPEIPGFEVIRRLTREVLDPKSSEERSSLRRSSIRSRFKPRRCTRLKTNTT